MIRENRYTRGTDLWLKLTDTDTPAFLAAQHAALSTGHVPGAYRRKLKRFIRLDRVLTHRPRATLTTRQLRRVALAYLDAM